MMVMRFDNFFMFYSTIFLVLCYMNTYLTTRLVASTHGMHKCIIPRAAVLHIAPDDPRHRPQLRRVDPLRLYLEAQPSALLRSWLYPYRLRDFLVLLLRTAQSSTPLNTVCTAIPLAPQLWQSKSARICCTPHR